jgi:iron complex transport system substrate-binding protein
MLERVILRWLIVFAFIGLVAGSSAWAPTPASDQGRGRQVTDETGRRMTVPGRAQRIVSLAPSVTEIVYALGAGDRLVGDTNFCDTPPEAKLKPHVGSTDHPSLEAIVALRPDLVLASGSINFPETADTLLKLGIPVYTTYPETVRQVLDSIVHIADVIGSEQQGEDLRASLRARLDALEAKVADKPLAHVLFLVWLSPPQSIGSNTFIADALRWAGAESVLTTDQNWPQPTFEELLRIQPDYIVFTPEHGTSDVSAQMSELRSRRDWQGLAAVRLGRVVTVSDAMERPAPGLVGAIEDLAHDLHPEAFANCNAAEATCGR